MRKLPFALAGLAAVAVLLTGQTPDATPSPQFTADGQLLTPKDYREWMYLSSGLGMTYGPAAATTTDPRFENVFVTPAAYREFMKTGTWPDKTMFILEIRESVTRKSINKDGKVQGDIAAIEAEVKSGGKWTFYDLGKTGAPAKPIANTAACYTCHPQNGAVDNTFVQFYPTLISVAKQHGTYKEKAE